MAQTGFILRRRKDDGWVATEPDFINDEMDPVGFGTTAADAVEDLLRHPRFREWMTQSGRPAPRIDEFDVDDRDDDGIFSERDGKHGNFRHFAIPANVERRSQMTMSAALLLVMALSLMPIDPAFAQSERDSGVPRGEAQTGDMNNPQDPAAVPEVQAQPGESAASEARIRAMLEKQGYGDVQNIQKQGDAYIATATKEGERVQVRVDPQLGQIEEHSR